MLFRRQLLLDLLYKRLPDKETQVLTNKKVVSVETNDHRVTVRCDDGSIEEGSIAIGCDGVHSRVRGIMNDLALKSAAKARNSEAPMVAHYQFLAGHLHRIPYLEPGRLWEVRNDGLNMQIFMLEQEGWFLIYRRLPNPSHQYTGYTDVEAEAFAKDIMDNPIMQGMTFKDLWEVHKWVRLVNAEEGLVERWYSDRIVLVGDSAHKMTPNAGLSVNQGWQGVVALTNLLRKLLSTNPDPDTESLTKALNAYQIKTEKMARDSLWLSKLYTRTTSWHNIAYKLVDYVGPYLGGDMLLFKMHASPIVRQGLILDFVPETGYKEGKIKWDNKLPSEK